MELSELKKLLADWKAKNKKGTWVYEIDKKDLVEVLKISKQGECILYHLKNTESLPYSEIITLEQFLEMLENQLPETNPKPIRNLFEPIRNPAETNPTPSRNQSETEPKPNLVVGENKIIEVETVFNNYLKNRKLLERAFEVQKSNPMKAHQIRAIQNFHFLEIAQDYCPVWIVEQFNTDTNGLFNLKKDRAASILKKLQTRTNKHWFRKLIQWLTK